MALPSILMVWIQFWRGPGYKKDPKIVPFIGLREYSFRCNNTFTYYSLRFIEKETKPKVFTKLTKVLSSNNTLFLPVSTHKDVSNEMV